MKRGVWIAVALGTMISGAAAIGIDAPSAPAPAVSTHLERTALLDAAETQP